MNKIYLYMVFVFFSVGLSPKNYRKFNIRYDLKDSKISRIDDYYMMEEVLTRRLSKIDKKCTCWMWI